jgi:hypothetical protein
LTCKTGAAPAYCLGVVEGWFGGVPVLLSGIVLEPELGGVGIESDEFAGGVEVSDGIVLGGVLDCIELSVAGAVVSGPVACCREQAAASASALRLKSNKPRFIESPRCGGKNNLPAAFSSGACPNNAFRTSVFLRGRNRPYTQAWHAGGSADAKPSARGLLC